MHVSVLKSQTRGNAERIEGDRTREGQGDEEAGRKGGREAGRVAWVERRSEGEE
jgi:hypothetical protein